LQEEQEFINRLLNPKTQNQAFQQLLQDYQRPLYNHVRSIVLNHDEMMYYKMFYKNFQNLKNFKEKANFSWMYRIATNESLLF
jgi:RNA polymerase sigma-70 factor (ECF subfamily)